MTLQPRIYQADWFLICSGIPAWKRLIDRPFTTDERISLITAIFSDRGEIEAVKRLCGDHAQPFVDVIDEVLLPSLSQEGQRTEPTRTFLFFRVDIG